MSDEILIHTIKGLVDSAKVFVFVDLFRGAQIKNKYTYGRRNIRD